MLNVQMWSTESGGIEPGGEGPDPGSGSIAVTAGWGIGGLEFWGLHSLGAEQQCPGERGILDSYAEQGVEAWVREC